VPYFEGWVRNSDESFDMVFGYFNRNTQQEFSIPAGPNNSVMPGGPDRGQPTYFLPRRQPRIFRVRVPKDWGDKPLTWTIIANGRTEKVLGKLLPSEEVNERFIMTGGNTLQLEPSNNKAPSLSIAPIKAGNPGVPVTLIANIADDGLPRPRPVPVPRVGQTADGRFVAQRNSSGENRIVGPRVTWLEYHGPAKVTFETNPVAAANGKAETKASFAAPGTYMLRATVTDGELSSHAEVTVTITANPATSNERP
jgi:hypothetical protein